MVLHQIAKGIVAYGYFKLPRIRRRSCAYILSMITLLVRANISSSSPFYDLDFPPAGHTLYLPNHHTPTH